MERGRYNEIWKARSKNWKKVDSGSEAYSAAGVPAAAPAIKPVATAGAIIVANTYIRNC